jgi:peptidoglycan-associated lipoprotein
LTTIPKEAKMRRSTITIVLALLVPLVLAGCPKKPKYPLCKNDKDCMEGEKCVDGTCVQCQVDSDCPSGQACVEGVCGKDAGGGGDDEIAAGSVSSSVDECGLDTIFFDFDSSQLKPPAVAALKKVAECLIAKGAKDITIVGHCDPRGTEEYNMGLGLERANTIKKFLVTYGIAEGEMVVYSKGEEDAEGTDEEGWSKDRKGEFK